MVSGLAHHRKGAASSRAKCLALAAMAPRRVPPTNDRVAPSCARRNNRPVAVPGIEWAEDFLFAGTSALLLLAAGLWPSLWYLSFLALVPFLHRVIRAAPRQALRLGFLLGISYFAVSLAGPFYLAPVATLARLTAATLALAGFGWAVGAARKHWGFNPLIPALLWVAFELILIRAGFAHGLLAELDVGWGFLSKAGVLCGFLAISFLIVLFNAVIVLAIETAVSAAQARGTVYPESKRLWDPYLVPGLVAQRLYLAAESRGPPPCCHP